MKARLQARPRARISGGRVVAGLGLAAALAGCPPRTPVDADGSVVELGQVRIWTYPKGAKVWVDGELELVTTPSTLIEKAGRYRLKLQVEGGEPYETDVEIEAGETKLLDLDLPPPPDSTITVYADVDGATVRINGYKRGETPLEDVITRPGPVDITVVGPGHRARSIRSQLAIGERKVFEVSFTSTVTDVEGTGTITVGMEPPGYVELADGTRLGEAPVIEKEVDAGPLELVLVSKDGAFRRRVEIDVRPDELSVYRFQLGEDDRIEPAAGGAR
jgi:hypothetical protein